jgi:ribonuclease HIII
VNKEICYTKIKDVLSEQGYIVGNYESIQCGIQFIILGNKEHLLKIYENKKGRVKVDYSAIKDELFRKKLEILIKPIVYKYAANSKMLDASYTTDYKNKNTVDVVIDYLEILNADRLEDQEAYIVARYKFEGMTITFTKKKFLIQGKISTDLKHLHDELINKVERSEKNYVGLMNKQLNYYSPLTSKKNTLRNCVNSDNYKKILDSSFSNEISKKQDNLLTGIAVSGKNHFFGPITIVVVNLKRSEINKLIDLEIGTKDISADEIKSLSKFSVMTIDNLKYNQLYNEFKNQNKIIEYCRVKALKKIGVSISDNNKKELAKEDILASGIASEAAKIIADNEYLKVKSRLKNKYGINFPGGASSEKVVEAKDMFINVHGEDKLEKVAKTHFKTAQKTSKPRQQSLFDCIS